MQILIQATAAYVALILVICGARQLRAMMHRGGANRA